MIRLVVLDGAALNPGDLSWEPLAALGELIVHPRSAPAECVSRARGAAVVLTNKTRLDRSFFEALPELRLVAVLATGTDIVDLEGAAEHGVKVMNVPEYGTASVAQQTLALLLEVATGTGLHDAAVHAGTWTRAVDWTFWQRPLLELEGRTFGIVGFGRIGRRVAKLAEALGMRVIAAQWGPSAAFPGPPLADVSSPQPVRRGLDELFAESDVVSLHCPLTPATRQLVDARRLALMRREAILINTARGALIDEPALAAALHAGHLRGAGLDVLSVEPPPADHPLLSAPRCVITPHIAWATTAARQRLMTITAENLKTWGRAFNFSARV